MALSARLTGTLGLSAALMLLLASPGCVDIVGSDLGRARYIEREEKLFPVAGKPEVVLSTFDGSIEIRPWDKPDVQVVVEKRGRDKEDVAVIDVQASQNGNRIEVTVSEPKNDGGLNIQFHNYRSAKLIVSLPAHLGRLGQERRRIDRHRAGDRPGAAALRRRLHSRAIARGRRERAHRRRIDQARERQRHAERGYRRRQHRRRRDADERVTRGPATAA